MGNFGGRECRKSLHFLAPENRPHPLITPPFPPPLPPPPPPPPPPHLSPSVSPPCPHRAPSLRFPCLQSGLPAFGLEVFGMSKTIEPRSNVTKLLMAKKRCRARGARAAQVQRIGGVQVT